MTTFACYPKSLEPGLHGSVLGIKQQIAFGKKPDHEFLTYMHQVSLMAHSSETSKIASFAAHLYEEFKIEHAIDEPMAKTAGNDARSQTERSGSGKKEEKAKQPSANPLYEEFLNENLIFTAEMRHAVCLEEPIAASRCYILEQYIIASFSNETEEIGCELLELAIRSIAVFWRGYEQMENLEIQACAAVIRRIVLIINKNNANLRLLTRERAESFAVGRRASQIVKELLPDRAASSYSEIINLLSVFLSAFEYMCRNATKISTSEMFNCCLKLRELKNVTIALFSAGMPISRCFSQTIEELCTLLLNDFENIIQEYSEQVQKYEKLGDYVVEKTESDEAIVLAQELLGLKAPPKDMEGIELSYRIWVQKVQKIALEYIELYLDLQEVVSCSAVYSAVIQPATQPDSLREPVEDFLVLDFQAAFESITYFCRVADKFQEKDGNQSFIEFFASLPMVMALVDTENCNFQYLNVQRTGNAMNVAQELLTLTGKAFALFHEANKTILQSSPIFTIANNATMFHERFLSIFRTIITAMFEFTPLADKKAVDKKASQSQLTEIPAEALSGIISALTAPGAQVLSLPEMGGIKSHPYLSLLVEIALLETIEAVKSHFAEPIGTELVQVELNILAECHKIFNFAASTSKDEKEKTIEDNRNQGEILLQNCSVPPTNLVLLILTEYCCDALLNVECPESQLIQLNDLFNDFKLVYAELEASSIEARRVSVNFRVISLLIEKDNAQETMCWILSNTLEILKDVMQSDNINSERKSRFEMDCLLRVVALVQKCKQFAKLRISEHLLAFCQLDRDQGQQTEIVQEEEKFSNLREQMLMESLQKSILRESIAKRIISQDRRPEQPSTMPSYEKWRSVFIHMLLESLADDHRFEAINDLAISSRDRIYILQNQTLLCLVVKAQLQIGKIDEIQQLLENISLIPSDNIALLRAVISMLISVRYLNNTTQHHRVIEFCISQARALLEHSEDKEIDSFLLFVEFVSQYNEGHMEYCRHEFKRQVEEGSPLFVLLEMAPNLELEQPYLQELIKTFVGSEIEDDCQKEFAEEISLSGEEIEVTEEASDTTIQESIEVVNAFIRAESQLSIPLFTNCLKKAYAKPVSFGAFVKLCSMVVDYALLTVRKFGNDGQYLLLMNASKWVNAEVLQQCRKYLERLAEESLYFVFESRELQCAMLRFGINLVFQGLHEAAQLIFQSEIGSPALERDLFVAYVRNFYDSGNSTAISESHQLYLALCHVPKLVLKSMINFNIGQFRQSYETVVQAYPFFNIIQQRLASRIVLSALHDNQNIASHAMLLPDCDLLSLALKVLVASTVLCGACTERICDLVIALEKTEIRIAARQCHILLAALPVYGARRNVINASVLDEREWLRISATHLVFGHNRTTNAIIFEQFVQTELYEQGNFSTELPEASFLEGLYGLFVESTDEPFNEQTAMFEISILLSAPNFVFDLVLRNEQLPRIAAMQLLTLGRRLLISRMLLQEILDTAPERDLHLMMSQLNVLLANLAQNDAKELSDACFEGCTYQDALITRYLATLTRDVDLNPKSWLMEPKSYNIAVPDLLEQIIRSMVKSGICSCAIEMPEASPGTVISAICSLQTAFELDSGAIKYQKTVNMRVSEPTTVGTKGAAVPSEIKFATQVYASQVALQLISETAWIAFCEFADDFSEGNSLLPKLGAGPTHCAAVASELLTGRIESAMQEYSLQKEDFLNAMENSGMRLVQKILESLSLAYQVNAADVSLLARASALLIDFRRRHTPQLVGIDRSVLVGLALLQNKMFARLACENETNVFQKKQQTVAFSPAPIEGFANVHSTNLTEIFAEYSEIEIESITKGAKKPQKDEELHFTAFSEKNDVAIWLEEELDPLETVIRRKFGRLAHVDAGMLVLVFPLYSIVSTTEKSIVLPDLTIETAFESIEHAAETEIDKDFRERTEFYRMNSAHSSSIRELIASGDFEGSNALLDEYDDFVRKCSKLEVQAAENVNGLETPQREIPSALAILKSVVVECGDPSCISIGLLGLLPLALSIRRSVRLIMRRAHPPPVAVTQPAATFIDVINDLLFVSKNGEDIGAFQALSRLRSTMQSCISFSASDEIVDTIFNTAVSSVFMLHPLEDLRIATYQTRCKGETFITVRAALEFSHIRSLEKCASLSQSDILLSQENYAQVVYLVQGGARTVQVDLTLAEFGLLLWRALLEVIPRVEEKKKDSKRGEVAQTTWEGCISQCGDVEPVIFEGIV